MGFFRVLFVMCCAVVCVFFCAVLVLFFCCSVLPCATQTLCCFVLCVVLLLCFAWFAAVFRFCLCSAQLCMLCSVPILFLRECFMVCCAVLSGAVPQLLCCLLSLFLAGWRAGRRRSVPVLFCFLFCCSPLPCHVRCCAVLRCAVLFCAAFCFYGLVTVLLCYTVYQ